MLILTQLTWNIWWKWRQIFVRPLLYHSLFLFPRVAGDSKIWMKHVYQQINPVFGRQEHTKISWKYSSHRCANISFIFTASRVYFTRRCLFVSVIYFKMLRAECTFSRFVGVNNLKINFSAISVQMYLIFSFYRKRIFKLKFCVCLFVYQKVFSEYFWLLIVSFFVLHVVQ